MARSPTYHGEKTKTYNFIYFIFYVLAIILVIPFIGAYYLMGFKFSGPNNHHKRKWSEF